MCDIVWRDETADHAAVAELVSAAFGRAHEADIVAQIRTAPALVLSMVAQRNTEILAHVLCSRVTIEPDTGLSACARGRLCNAVGARQSALLRSLRLRTRRSVRLPLSVDGIGSGISGARRSTARRTGG
jgi:hypothetical protein